MLASLLHKIAAEEIAEQEPHEFYPRPSLAGPERCIRQMAYWARKEETRPMQGRAGHIFDDGHWHEELVKEWIAKSAYTLHSTNLEVETECGKGHPDGILTDLLGVDRVIEIKGINHFTFEAIWKGAWPLDNLTQLALYIRGVQVLNPEITEGLLFIKNKNTAQYMDLLCRYDREADSLTILDVDRSDGQKSIPNYLVAGITSSAREKFATVLTSSELPARQYENDHWRCQYCQYGKTCWSGYVAEHNALTADAALDNELADTIRFERQLQAEESEAKKEREKIRKEIKDSLLKLKARSGRAGEFLIDWQVKAVRKMDADLLPPAAVEAAMVDDFEERLSIKRIKESEA